MKRSLLVADDPPRPRRFEDGTSALYMPVGDNSLRDLVVEFCLLYFGLSERLTIRSADGPVFVLGLSALDFGEVNSDGEPLKLWLSQRQLEQVLSYLLRYERDGAAEVAHLDVEIGSEGEFTLVIQARESTEPMPGPEAMRLLGVEEDALDDFS